MSDPDFEAADVIRGLPSDPEKTADAIHGFGRREILQRPSLLGRVTHVRHPEPRMIVQCYPICNRAQQSVSRPDTKVLHSPRTGLHPLPPALGGTGAGVQKQSRRPVGAAAGMQCSL